MSPLRCIVLRYIHKVPYFMHLSLQEGSHTSLFPHLPSATRCSLLVSPCYSGHGHCPQFHSTVSPITVPLTGESGVSTRRLLPLNSWLGLLATRNGQALFMSLVSISLVPSVQRIQQPPSTCSKEAHWHARSVVQGKPLQTFLLQKCNISGLCSA